MSYEVILSPKSYKQLKAFDEALKERLRTAALEIRHQKSNSLQIHFYAISGNFNLVGL